MCGISGVLGPKANPEDIKIMLAAITHRGPDEFGVYSQRHIAMGTARLAIVDLSGGQQPITDKETGATICFNGEVFNYVELRESLIQKGHKFHTHSDTEVTLRMYLEYGEEFPKYLNGQFAISIWDPRSSKLVLARDRYGICPLFYHQKGETFAWGSEIKTLLTLPYVPRELNHKAIDQIFTFWTAIGSHTVLKDIMELPPGNMMILKGNERKIQKYWDWPFPEMQKQFTGNFEQAKEGLLNELTKAISIRMRADVEVGSYLSGGLDSSAIVALTCGRLGHKLRTYSIEFAEKSYDESQYQQMVSQKYNTVHKAFQCTENDIAERFQQVLWHTETPLFRTAPTPLNLLSESVRKDGLKVVLTGEGSDEILLGYDIFRETKIRRFCAKSPNSDWRPQLFKRLYAYLPQFANPRFANLAIESLKKSLNSNSPFFSHEIRWGNNAANKIYFSEALRDGLKGYNAIDELASIVPENFHKAGDVSRAQYLEINTLLRGYLLSSQGDRQILGNSVEGRFPFLDHELLNFVSTLPQRYKLSGLKDKHILRESMKGLLPDEVRLRPKFAYQAPEVRAFYPKDKPVSGLIEKYLNEYSLKDVGMFDVGLVKNLLLKISQSEHSRLSTRDNTSFVQVLSTQIFNEMFVKADIRKFAIEKLKSNKVKISN